MLDTPHGRIGLMVLPEWTRAAALRGVEWVAGTAIAGPDGWLLAGPRNDALGDRRHALYG